MRVFSNRSEKISSGKNISDTRGGPELDYRPNGTRKICSEGGGLFASTFAANGIANLWNQLSVFNQSACNIACDSM